MAKPQTDVENPMVMERTTYRSTETVVMYKPDILCRCGCGKEIVEGCLDWSGDYYYDKDCVINDLLRSKEMKIIVDYSIREAV